MKGTPFLTWLWRTQQLRMLFIHALLIAMAVSLSTDRPEHPWDIAGWVTVAIPAIGYWTGNFWYWAVRLNRGTKC